tara:strand:+ start:185 stop:340 length:156 start_codon:yes stop_codon:yes gene_type:complete
VPKLLKAARNKNRVEGFLLSKFLITIASLVRWIVSRQDLRKIKENTTKIFL